MLDVYVISLKTATDRRKHIASEFAKAGIAYHFFDAIEPHQIDNTAKQLNVDMQNSNLTVGEKACFLSHLVLWQTAIENNQSHIAIFEDDVYLGNSIKHFFDNCDWLPKDCHLLKLELFDRYRLMTLKKHPVYDRHIKQLKENHLGTAGYIISQLAISSMMSHIKTHSISMPIDRLMFENYILDKMFAVYQLQPALCVQSDRIQINHLNIKNQVLNSSLEAQRNIVRQNYITPKRDFFDKVMREIVRPFEQIYLKILSLYRRIFCQIDFK